MLSAAKVRIHGMQDDNWVIKDKINQYRGLIKLYGNLQDKSYLLFHIKCFCIFHVVFSFRFQSFSIILFIHT